MHRLRIARSIVRPAEWGAAAYAQAVSQQHHCWRAAAFPRKIPSMPTVLRSGPYRFFFYSADRDEPRHVHVERAEARAKFWLDPIRLAESVGFGRPELADIERLVVQQAVHVRKAWDDFFTD